MQAEQISCDPSPAWCRTIAQVPANTRFIQQFYCWASQRTLCSLSKSCGNQPVVQFSFRRARRGGDIEGERERENYIGKDIFRFVKPKLRRNSRTLITTNPAPQIIRFGQQQNHRDRYELSAESTVRRYTCHWHHFNGKWNYTLPAEWFWRFRQLPRSTDQR